jgi:hypothetical protein
LVDKYQIQNNLSRKKYFPKIDIGLKRSSILPFQCFLKWQNLLYQLSPNLREKRIISL